MKYNTEIRKEYHEIANGEPMMQEAELDLLMESMEAIGYDKIKPITIYEGLILDGRNRYVVAEHLGIEPEHRTFEGTYEEALAESIRLNNARRHKSPSQKAMAGAYGVHTNRVNREIYKKELLDEYPNMGRDRLGRKIGEKYPKLPTKDSAKSQGVDERYVKNALKLLGDNIELADAVFDGEMSLTKAMKTYSEIEDLKRKAKRSADGKYTPEEIKRFRQIQYVKENPEIVAIVMASNENELFKQFSHIRKLTSLLEKQQALIDRDFAKFKSMHSYE